MNISKIFSSTYLNNITSNKQSQGVDTTSSTDTAQNTQKPDAITSATITKGGDHYFEARG
jgi:hypothetical protein